MGGLVLIVLGASATVELPFYCVSVMVAVSIVLITLFFHDKRTEMPPFEFKPFGVFLTLWEAAKRPVILKLSLVFFFSQLTLNGFYVFMDNYYFSRFHFDTLENSIALVVLGIGLGFASAYLVTPVNARFGRIPIIRTCVLLMGFFAALSIVNPSGILAYVLIIPFIVPFAIYYPRVLTMFSLAVDESEQGWVMGVTVALYTLGAGMASLLGGRLMEVNIHLPFAIACVSAVIALILIQLFWRGEDMRALARK